MIFKHFINRNPKFAKSGNYRDQTALFSKLQVLNCNFPAPSPENTGVAGEHDSGTLTSPQAPDHIYRQPGIDSCNQNTSVIPVLAGKWPRTSLVSGEPTKTSKHNSLRFTNPLLTSYIPIDCKFHKEHNPLYFNS